MSFTCDLSGQPLSSTKEEVVVTPSGHVCIKRLLLTKLAENGSMDPFAEAGNVPLSEDTLITLNAASSNKIIPPRPQVTTMPNLLQLLQSEYDNLVLELFDTRKALEDTRKELSQALYQNDAAVRVVARLAMERDQAREELLQWTKTGAASTAAATTTTEQEEPPAKKPKTTPAAAAAEQPDQDKASTIPQSHLDILTSTWETLSKNRKANKKEIASKAPDAANFAQVDSKAWHLSSGKQGIVDIRHDNDKNNHQVVTAGKDKQVCVYNQDKKALVSSITTVAGVTAVDVLDKYVLVATNKGVVRLYQDETEVAKHTVGGKSDHSSIVAVDIHPSGQHACILQKSNRLTLMSLMDLEEICHFCAADKDVVYTAGKLHPDGLIYAAGTSEGHLLLWDFKSQQLASELKIDSDQSAICDIAFSNNGYHLTTTTVANKVQFWDLKKQKTLTTLEGSNCAAFDISGKYLAYASPDKGVIITTVKEWGETAKMGDQHVTGMVWTEHALMSCSDKNRAVKFYSSEASKSDDAMEE